MFLGRGVWGFPKIGVSSLEVPVFVNTICWGRGIYKRERERDIYIYILNPKPLTLNPKPIERERERERARERERVWEGAY